MLWPFKELLKDDKGIADLRMSNDKSNVMYKKLLTNKTNKVIIQSDFLRSYCDHENTCENNAFYKKNILRKRDKT